MITLPYLRLFALSLYILQIFKNYVLFCIDVSNWKRYDSLESFVCGRFTNPPDENWLTSLPILLVWQRVGDQSWKFEKLPYLASLQRKCGSACSSALSTMSVEVPMTSSQLSRFSATKKINRTYSPASSLCGATSAMSIQRDRSHKFVLTPPSLQKPTIKTALLKRTTAMSNSQFLQKSLERLSAQRKCVVGKIYFNYIFTIQNYFFQIASSRSSSSYSTSHRSSSRTNDSFVSPRSSMGSEPKRSRLDVSGSDFDF